MDIQGNWSGYFLTVPTVVQTAATTKFVQSGMVLETIDTPVLRGGIRGGIYDRALDRWLPAEWSAVSPDGTQYAYATGPPGGDNELHIVDVRTGDDQVVVNQGQFYPLAYRSDGLYLVQRNAGSGLRSGSSLFVLDPATQAIRQLHSSSRTETWQYIVGNFAYGADINPSDPNPAGSGEASDELIRLDLSSGAVTSFQYHPGQHVYLVGLTSSGQPLAVVGGLVGFQLVDAAGAAASIPGAPIDAWGVFNDSKRTWLLAGMPPGTLAGHARSSSIYLLSNGQAIHEMDFFWYRNDQLAGTCL